MLAVLWWSFGEVEMVDSLAIVGFGYVVELEFVFKGLVLICWQCVVWM